ncbi:conserved hypothetical protein [Culex quinquefasciatus]|uniref:Uncharacterized protein n=1 Tax=Culex quinquefasciatus TaxID=7176 RepID=B0WC45_CULQU|nr:conserved hypothetical protein [Culex quinquefasciatus]|eukprot:XP_001846279.1 conserved hypothetical protein [Culex quinquefasciatus]
MADENENSCDKFDTEVKPDKMFTLKKWNAVAMWSWDVECDTCAICRVQVMVPGDEGGNRDDQVRQSRLQ